MMKTKNIFITLGGCYVYMQQINIYSTMVQFAGLSPYQIRVWSQERDDPSNYPGGGGGSQGQRIRCQLHRLCLTALMNAENIMCNLMCF